MSARPLAAAATLASLVLACGPAGAVTPTAQAPRAAQAQAIRILLPGQAAVTTGSVSAPTDEVAFGSSFSYSR